MILDWLLWNKIKKVFGKETYEELYRAKLLKEYADKTGVKVYIRIPSLNIAYEYDPIEEKIKRKKLELLKLLLKEKKLKLEIRKPTRADDKITLF